MAGARDRSAPAVDRAADSAVCVWQGALPVRRGPRGAGQMALPRELAHQPPLSNTLPLSPIYCARGPKIPLFRPQDALACAPCGAPLNKLLYLFIWGGRQPAQLNQMAGADQPNAAEARLVEENKELRSLLLQMEKRLCSLEKREETPRVADEAKDSADANARFARLLEFLGTETKPTLDIAKHVLGPNATKGQINPILYELQKKQKIARVGDTAKGNPMWKKL